MPYVSGAVRPGTSDVNAAAGQVVPAMAIIGPGPDGRFQVRNAAGSAHVVVDASGYFL